MSCSQSGANDVFHRWKRKTKNKNCYSQSEPQKRCFFTCEKNDTSNQKPQRCVSFAPNFPPFIGACTLRRPRFVSCSRKLNWNRFAYKFMYYRWSNLKITSKLTIEGKKNQTRRKLVLSIGAKLIRFCLYSNPSFTQNHSFLIIHSGKMLKLLVITGLLHILAQVIIFTKRLFFVISRCVAGYFGNFRIWKLWNKKAGKMLNVTVCI